MTLTRTAQGHRATTIVYVLDGEAFASAADYRARLAVNRLVGRHPTAAVVILQAEAGDPDAAETTLAEFLAMARLDRETGT